MRSHLMRKICVRHRKKNGEKTNKQTENKIVIMNAEETIAKMCQPTLRQLLAVCEFASISLAISVRGSYLAGSK